MYRVRSDSPATWYVTFFVASGPRSEGLQMIVRGSQSDDAFLENGRIIILELQTDTVALFTAGLLLSNTPEKSMSP